MLAFASTIFAAVAIVQAYTWPSPQLDALEAARFDPHTGPLLAGVQPCDTFAAVENTGRANAADWVRTAYHDMATYNIADGTGGLDGSIRFTEEINRPENSGDGFDRTMAFVAAQSGRYISELSFGILVLLVADSIALATIVAIETCGGPEIPFRGNRTDATSPNAPGVPEPQEDLDSHITSFKRQGFNKEEMIGLVACGHTFGGVQHETFPEIVPEMNDPENTQFNAFNPLIQSATEYMSGTTENPLVVGMNDTTNSDKRIFESDGNVTMKSFADSPSLFASTCSTLIARMIDTVPKQTQLTDVLTPLPIKPADIRLDLRGSTIEFSGKVRLWNTPKDDSRSYSSSWYSFSDSAEPLSIDAAAGLKSLSFVVDGKLENQGGLGFAVEDRVMHSTSSCRLPGDTTSRIDVAVRNADSPIRVYLEEFQFNFPDVSRVVEHDIPQPLKPVTIGVYSIWSLNLTTDGMVYNIGAEFAGGVKYSTLSTYFAGRGTAPCG
ncbi:peroxidase [Favolaschia claudopus]|uniref:Peroxidase n=1 Tax=Favolaschia claudopus TaxID=2862362 RepID=A0AAW0CLT1_9AGAR